MERAFRNLSRLLGEEVAEFYWRERLKRVQKMPGAGKKLECIAAKRGKEELCDYLAEIKFALIFAGLKFEVEIEPLGEKEKGPDLLIQRDNYNMFVEVKRFRHINPGPKELSLSDESPILLEYGDIKRDTKKVLDSILDKFSQVTNEDSMIVFLE
jgi:hypothetical protein